MTMKFLTGDLVEVCSKEDGFLGSYYEATVLAHLENKTFYIVRYKNLLENEESALLTETVRANEVRPIPPTVFSSTFSLHEKVDAFDNVGWWVGKVTGREDSDCYFVYFETTLQLIAYPHSKLRIHRDWVGCKWVMPRKTKYKKL